MTSGRRSKQNRKDAAEPTPVTTDEASRVLQEERDKRTAACRSEIQQVLQKHRCVMLAEVRFRQGAQAPMYNIVIAPVP